MQWRFFVSGQRRPVSIPLNVPTVAAAVCGARSRPAPAHQRDRLRARLHEDGRVRCHKVRVGRSTPPYFRGQLRQTGGGVVLEGVIRESRSSGFVTVLYSVIALLLLVVAVVCAVSRPVVVPGLVICGLGALALGLLSFGLRWARLLRFKYEAEELDAKIREYFGAQPLPPKPVTWYLGNR